MAMENLFYENGELFYEFSTIIIRNEMYSWEEKAG